MSKFKRNKSEDTFTLIHTTKLNFGEPKIKKGKPIEFQIKKLEGEWYNIEANEEIHSDMNIEVPWVMIPKAMQEIAVECRPCMALFSIEY